MKTQYTIYNTVVGLIYYIITVVLGLLNRRVLVYTLGIEYQGINGLFSNIISMLSIAELGVGIAIIYHLYRPLAEDNKNLIKAIMTFYKQCYNIIAAIILIIGLLLMPFLPFIVPSYNLPISIQHIYVWYLLDAVCSYLFTYKRSILIADQKNYIVILGDIAYQFVSKGLQIVFLIVTENFLLYLATTVICRLGENILLNIIVLRKYPFLKESDSIALPKDIYWDIKLKVKGTIFHKIGSFLVLGVDNILISKFFGLKIVGIYSNYQLIINVLRNISSQIIVAATAGIGRILVEDKEEKTYSIFCQLQLLNAGIMNFVTTGLYCVITPVIKLIFGENLIFGEPIVFVLALKFYITGMRQVYAVFKETAGVLYEDRYVPIIESLINIIASLILLHIYGVIGIFIGTIISSLALFCYTYPILVYKRILRHKIVTYYKQLVHLGGIAFISLLATKCVIGYWVVSTPWLQILINCFICCLIPNILFYLLYARSRDEWIALKKRIANYFS